MRAHQANADVAHYGCLALNIISNSDAGRQASAAAGGAAAVVAAMRVHPANADILKWGGMALKRIRE